jgi:flagellar biosynthesis GTPase FlhF
VITKWLRQLVSALSYMHNIVKILHRDIKPENILLTSDGTIKIVDVGFACVITSCAMSKVGTALYHSPQKAHGYAYDGRDDMWALGCVLIELCIHMRLAEYLKCCGGNLYEAHDHVESTREDLISQCIAFDEFLGGLIRGMLQVDQAKRVFSTDVLEALEKKETLSIGRQSSGIRDAEIVRLREQLEETEKARARAEAEAKAKANEDARTRAEAEAKAKADEDARTRAEAEAKAKADEEARTRAEAEAKAKADEEARTRAEAEAKAKAERKPRGNWIIHSYIHHFHVFT